MADNIWARYHQERRNGQVSLYDLECEDKLMPVNNAKGEDSLILFLANVCDADAVVAVFCLSPQLQDDHCIHWYAVPYVTVTVTLGELTGELNKITVYDNSFDHMLLDVAVDISDTQIHVYNIKMFKGNSLVHMKGSVKKYLEHAILAESSEVFA